ncbi:MAG TPA: hypothetical protein VK524_29680 [Polyangiaceae bacterium]|nr:hypothetical protein [Polyangiaceae bacterium]
MLIRTLFTRSALVAVFGMAIGTACGPTPIGGGVGGAGGSAGSAGTPTNPLPGEDALTRLGPYPTELYENGLPDSPSYGAATVFFPGGNAVAPFPAVAMAPGFSETRQIFENWGRFLSSHGFVVLTFDTNAGSDSPDVRANALSAALNVIRGENSRGGSPLNGKVDVNRMAIMGHSMGGGGTFILASRNPAGVLAAIPLHPWGGLGLGSIRVPTLVFAAQGDQIAGATAQAWNPYNQIPFTTKKAYIEFAGASALQEHFVANNPLGELPSQKIVAKASLSWLRAYVTGDTRYLQYIRQDGVMSRWNSTF